MLKRSHGWLALVAMVAVVGLTAIWWRTRSIDLEQHARIDAALRELRSLDRTINQDVLRARFQLVDSYQPVLTSYRRVEVVEHVLQDTPQYLTQASATEFSDAVRSYERATTNKQRMIERFKYEAANLKELLGYLPAAGTGVGLAAKRAGLIEVSAAVNAALQQTLLYNLTADEAYAPSIRRQLKQLERLVAEIPSHVVRRRVRTLARNIDRLLVVKPRVDSLLRDILAAPIAEYEARVAGAYDRGYREVDVIAARYRVLLYSSSVLLLLLVGAVIVRLRVVAAELETANELLEERVKERTQELGQMNQEMRVVLDNIEQALFTVDMQGRLSRERSAALQRWFPEKCEAQTLWSLLGDTPEEQGWIAVMWEQVASELLPPRVALGQLPQRLELHGRVFDIAYQPIFAGSDLHGVLVVVSDVTEKAERARRDAEQKEQFHLLQQLLSDRPGVTAFLNETQEILDLLTRWNDLEAQVRMRYVHTLKGNSAIYGLPMLSKRCHELEDRVASGGGDAEEFSKLNRAFREFLAPLFEWIGRTSSPAGHVGDAELERLRNAVSRGDAAEDLLTLLEHLQREPVELRLKSLGEKARALAVRLGKPGLRVEVVCEDVRLASERWSPLWSALIHAVRNALDHGIESPIERAQQGKPEGGLLRLVASLDGDCVVVRIEDDGRGIDWQSVRTRAEQLGKLAANDQELAQLLMSGGISTRGEVSELSGRGAGVGACYHACQGLGGTLRVESSLGRGTALEFVIPCDRAADEAAARRLSARSDVSAGSRG